MVQRWQPPHELMPKWMPVPSCTGVDQHHLIEVQQPGQPLQLRHTSRKSLVMILHHRVLVGV